MHLQFPVESNQKFQIGSQALEKGALPYLMLDRKQEYKFILQIMGFPWGNYNGTKQ